MASKCINVMRIIVSCNSDLKAKMVGQELEQSRRQTQKLKVTTAVSNHIVLTSGTAVPPNTHVTVAKVAWSDICRMTDVVSVSLSSSLLLLRSAFSESPGRSSAMILVVTPDSCVNHIVNYERACLQVVVQIAVHTQNLHVVSEHNDGQVVWWHKEKLNLVILHNNSVEPQIINVFNNMQQSMNKLQEFQTIHLHSLYIFLHNFNNASLDKRLDCMVAWLSAVGTVPSSQTVALHSCSVSSSHPSVGKRSQPSAMAARAHVKIALKA